MPESFVRYPLLMNPFFSPRPWGGQRLARVLGKKVPTQGGPFGESWELSDHPNGRSAVANGPYAGLEFGRLLRRFPREMAGVSQAPERFGLLVKYIDAAEDLSIQVHPDDAQAARAGERGKTECWFVMDCAPGTQLIIGLAPGVCAASLLQAAQFGQMEACLRRIRLRPGDFIDVPARTVHAILSGTLVCEVQQSSDMTYRLWDWDRQPARPLHLAESCEVARYGAEGLSKPFNVNDLAPGRWHSLTRNHSFEVRTAAWPAEVEDLVNVENRHGLVLNVIGGAGRMAAAGGEVEWLRLGQTWFLPAGLASWELSASPLGLRLLLSESLEL